MNICMTTTTIMGTTMDTDTITTMTTDTSIHMIMITNTVTITTTVMTMGTTTIMDMTTTMNMEAAAAMIALPMITANTNWFTIMRPIHMKRMWPVIRTPVAAQPAILMKSIAIIAAKAWPTANAVCRTPTT